MEGGGEGRKEEKGGRRRREEGGRGTLDGCLGVTRWKPLSREAGPPLNCGNVSGLVSRAESLVLEDSDCKDPVGVRSKECTKRPTGRHELIKERTATLPHRQRSRPSRYETIVQAHREMDYRCGGRWVGCVPFLVACCGFVELF